MSGSTHADRTFLDVIVRSQARGAPLGIYSVCSAHPAVLRAAFSSRAPGRYSPARGVNLQPGQSVRWLHRHDPGGLRRLHAGVGSGSRFSP